jgi:hypothetical protein
MIAVVNHLVVAGEFTNSLNKPEPELEAAVQPRGMTGRMLK